MKSTLMLVALGLLVVKERKIPGKELSKNCTKWKTLWIVQLERHSLFVNSTVNKSDFFHCSNPRQFYMVGHLKSTLTKKDNADSAKYNKDVCSQCNSCQKAISVISTGSWCLHNACTAWQLVRSPLSEQLSKHTIC